MSEHFISEELDHYITAHSAIEPKLLAELNKETLLKVLNPRMLSGHYQGRMLSMISKLINPKHILEIGTYTGYATLCLAEGLTNDGTVDTIDINEELVSIQNKYFERSDYRNNIRQHLGMALDIIPTLDKKFDLVFIDADKANYANYFDVVLPKMNPGGVILSDNVLWSGKVLAEAKPNDKSTVALKAYNEKINNDSRVESVILPIRDGLTITRVIK